MRRIGTIATVFALSLLLPIAARAQASLTGVVKDTSGGVLPGVTVEAASPALIEKVRSVATDASGQYRIENLRPGTYAITFTLTGFNTVKRVGIELSGSAAVTVPAELRVGALEETITVTGETPIVDVQGVTKQRVIDHAVIDAVPFNRNQAGLGLLIPGVSMSQGTTITQDVGGTTDTSISSLVSHGSRGGDQRITLNGISVGISNGNGSVSSISANMAAFQEVTVDSSAQSSELATGGVRINYIPRDGGNTFAGSVFANAALTGLNSSNYTAELKAAGLAAPGAVKELFDINPAFGGPIQKDRVWFFVTGRVMNNQSYPSGILSNLNANNPNAWTYVPDPASKPVNNTPQRNGQARLTWQATPKNKFGGMAQYDYVRYCVSNIGATVSPEAGIYRPFPVERNLAGDWSAPMTSRLLLDAAFFSRAEYVSRNPIDGTNPAMIAVTDQGLGNLNYRLPSPGGAQPSGRDTFYHTYYGRASATYVTGAHSVKVGFGFGRTHTELDYKNFTAPYEYRFNNGVPNQITLYAFPVKILFDQRCDCGAYAQDKWTSRRLTVTYGVRYDYYRNGFPDETLGPAPLAPTRNQNFPASDGVSWSDITPHVGVVYDVFGTGKTALKFSANKYLQGMGDGDLMGTALGPLTRIVLSTTRNWTDTNKNFVPDCVLTNPAAQTVVGGDVCGAMANASFGGTGASTTYDPNVLTGWGKRIYNWEISTGVQQVAPRVSVEVGYFRRIYGNFFVTDNLATAASDYTAFNFTAPNSDPRLPTAGSLITGYHDLNPALVGLTNNFVTSAANYGAQQEHWNGIDLSVNARPKADVTLQGGVSAGRTTTDNCAVAAALPEVLLVGTTWTPLQFCHVDTPFLTQVKLLGTYTVPKIDVRVSATFSNIPGPTIQANYAAPNAQVAPALGRNLSGNAQNTTLVLVPSIGTTNGTLFNSRINELDLRVGKLLRFAGKKVSVNLDLFNALNNAVVLSQNNSFGGAIAWQTPQSVMQARFVKLSGQFDF